MGQKVDDKKKEDGEEEEEDSAGSSPIPTAHRLGSIISQHEVNPLILVT